MLKLQSKHPDLLETIEKEKELSEENTAKKLKSFFEDFLVRFSKK